eukprot:scaffold85428_cov57-Phaeocystis_antarctica.AAC.1
MLVQPTRASPIWLCFRLTGLLLWRAVCLATGTPGGTIVDRSIMVGSDDGSARPDAFGQLPFSAGRGGN